MKHDPVGKQTKEFDDTAILVNGEFLKLHSIGYRVTETQDKTSVTIDVAEKCDFMFRNELTEDEERISLEEAVRWFLENIDNGDTQD